MVTRETGPSAIIVFLEILAGRVDRAASQVQLPEPKIDETWANPEVPSERLGPIGPPAIALVFPHDDGIVCVGRVAGTTLFPTVFVNYAQFNILCVPR